MTSLLSILLAATSIVMVACTPQAEQSGADSQSSLAQTPTASGPLSRPIRGDGGTSAFYSYDEDLPSQPGQLLRQEPMEPQQAVPGAAQSTRLLYTSTDGIDGTTITAVSGGLFLPAGGPPEGGWPLVLWSHGTVGIADRCAPTWNGYAPFHQEYLGQWIDRGFAIVASDYQGLGTAGTHPYLATQPASYSNLDVIRAVQNADFPVSDRVVLVGQSQGAAAVFATAGHAADYAAELDLRGVVATGIPFFSAEALAALSETRPRDKVDHRLGYNFLALTLVEQLDPMFEMEEYVSEEAMATVEDFDTQCYQDMKSVIVERELSYNRSFRVPPTEPLTVAFSQMGYPRLGLPMPVYIGSGDEDRDTPLRMQAALIKKSCAAGSIIESRVYAGFDHRTVLNHSTIDSIPFVEAVFNGEMIRGNCSALPDEAASDR